MIHGLRNGLGFLGPLHRAYDWIDGCLAVTNREIDELWRAVPDGTPIEIRSDSAAVQNEPVLPFHDWGACPFECCTYREWTTNGIVDLYEDIDSTERIATVARGERVVEVTGVVGYERVWVRGELHDAELATGASSAWNVLDPPTVEWWVQVRTRSDVVGWSNEPEKFDRKDACE